ncbi:MAG: hypothetical protein ACNI3A_01480 [Desulfovibrio sp.]|uniref:hypothetical protein n=1 Tax=Desulfovibrio sp. 7SRBS1 TaxID=3378064 RepID=UPI003B3EE84F
MAKLVEGQLEVWRLASELSTASHSMASQGLRDYVSYQEKLMTYAPDIIPRTVDVKPIVESDTGRIVSKIS